MSLASVEQMRELGRRLVEQGLNSVDLVTDLDETVWDWASAVARQPLLAFAHTEWIHVRRYLTALLVGIVQASDNTPIRVWTAGYGYRIDKVCTKIPALGRALGAGKGMSPSEEAEHMFTRLAFVRGLSTAPELLRGQQGLRVSSKLPGMPTAAQRSAVDNTKVLLDDRLTNCQHFVAGRSDRMAIHLADAQRKWTRSISRFKPWVPDERTWAPSIAALLQNYLAGDRGVHTARPVECKRAHRTVKVTLPHPVAYREWIRPGHQVRRELERLAKS
jgi:hypothetical protein